MNDFDELVRVHWREVHAMLTVITRNAATAEDLAQEVFLLAHRKQVTSGPGFRAWLRQTARYLALNELRRQRPVPVAPADLPELSDAHDTPTFDDELAALRLCVAGLEAGDRELVAARYEEGESLEEFAVRVGQSVGYVKQRLFRLRKRLAECVRRRLGGRDAQR
jgi:RNA polymerase sigma-70 factor (ECF subfamily)